MNSASKLPPDADETGCSCRGAGDRTAPTGGGRETGDACAHACPQGCDHGDAPSVEPAPTPVTDWSGSGKRDLPFPDETLDCQTCGACCYGDAMWIHLLAEDDERLGDDNVERFTVLTRHGRGYVARSMRMEGGRCIAYRDDLGDGKCGCSIYGIRPQICRDFDAGSPGCHAARRRRGLER